MSQHHSDDDDERMSDTDSEIIPSSQPDTSMVLTESQVAQVNQVRMGAGTQGMSLEQESLPISSASASQRNPFEDQLTCAICLSLMSNPFAITTCLHSFCRECLAQWWNSQNNCPKCKSKSDVARYNFDLANIIDQYRQSSNRVSRRQFNDSAREDLYPRGARRGHMLAAMSLPPTQSQSQSQFAGGGGGLLLDPILIVPSFASSLGTQSQSQPVIPQPLPDVFPGGNLVFPCPSCYPENNTGYQCPDPIHPPTEEQIQAEQQAYRPGGTPIRPPGRGDARIGLQAAILNQLPGSNSHSQCNGCSAYIPSGWFPERQKCGDCDVVLCSLYDPQGCTSGVRLHPRNALSGGVIDLHHLWQFTPTFVRTNADEEQRLFDYANHTGLTVDAILEQLAQLKLETERASARRNLPNGGGGEDDEEDEYAEDVQEVDRRCTAKWGPQAYFCDESVNSIISDFFFHWWMARVNIIKTSQPPQAAPPANNSFFGGLMGGPSQQPPALAYPEDCWYGYECRTQRNHPGHASRYNHICPNTSQQHRNRGYHGYSGTNF